ncbi:hypothetical protein VNO77_24722 [Canavalia gladiata]|uniref:Uncharacterized protein n=1 Tax=Canavalia gladiata TaxID=3824 RepID=A0AAN9QCW4_CANGL
MYGVMRETPTTELPPIPNQEGKSFYFTFSSTRHPRSFGCYSVATPLFVIFSPVLLPATLVVGLSVAGFLASGAFGATSFSSFAWLAAYIRREHAKLPGLDTAGYVAQKNEEVGDSVARKAQEAQKETASKAQETDREAKKETERKNQETVGQETQKENARKSQEAGQEAQKLTGETGKAYKDNKTSL